MGRWTRAIGVTAAAVTAYMWMSASLAQQDVHTTRSVNYVVQPGDTEWTIATKTAPDTYTPAVIQWIEQHNSVGTVLRAGEVLKVPAGR